MCGCVIVEEFSNGDFVTYYYNNGDMLVTCYNHVIFRCITDVTDVILHNRILGRDKLFGRKKDTFILEF